MTTTPSAGGNTVVFSNTVTGTITLTSGQVLITRDVTIAGPGAGILAITGGNVSRAFAIANTATAYISDLTIANCTQTASSERSGAGVANYATLFLNRCWVANNVTYQGNSGGGLLNAGTAHVSDCTFQGNFAVPYGGAIDNSSGSLTLTNCTLFNNSSVFGVGIANFASLTARSCTIVSNYSFDFDSGGIWNHSLATANVGNSIIARSSSPGSDVYGPFISQGYNLIGAANGSTGFAAVGDQVGTTNSPLNPLLGVLQNNGGPTLTMLPQPGSPAIDQGFTGGGADQRGRSRPSDNPAIINATLGDGSDIGAVEVSPLVVTTTNDAGAGSLRQTILDTSVVEHTITFASNVIGNVKLTSGELSVGRDLNIIGPGANVLAISGNNSSRAFYILSGWNVSISKLTIRDGRVSGSTGLPGQNGQEARGGGIMNEGTLSLASCVVSNSAVTGGTGGSDPNFAGNGGNGLGGGVGNIGTLTLTDCHVVSNSAAGGQGGVAPGGSDGMGGQGYGGALYTAGTATLIRSTISSNIANGGAGNGGAGSGSGGGLYNDSSLTLLTCTVAGNSAVGSLFDFGGGIYNNGTALTLRNSTIAGNQADYGGGLNTSGSADLGSTILAGNSGPGSGPDCSGNINSSDYNLIQNTSGATFTGTTAHNIIGLNPLLGQLAGNGGLPPTMALAYNSPAIDKGKSFGSTTDQRGAPRPFDFASVANASGGDGADIGAVELGSPALGIQSLSGSAIVSWPAYYGDFALQSITNLTSTNWTAAPGVPIVVGNQFNVTNGPTTGRSFYRLKQK